MKKKIRMMLAFAGISGYLVGWAMFGGPADVAPPPTATTTTIPASQPVRVEFPLQPADAVSDRETPAVAVDSLGRILIAWASQTGESECTLTLARSTDSGVTFSAPQAWRKVPIYRYQSKSKGKEVSYSTHVLPRLTSAGESIHLGWVEAIDGGPKVVYQVATSTDGGKTFSEPTWTHGAEAVKPGFTGMTTAENGSVLCAWLDGRAQGQRPHTSLMGIHSKVFESEQLVFAGPDGKGVCPCCDVSVVQDSDGSRYVAFRNNDGGNRDIVVCPSRPSEIGFASPIPVTPDHWKLDGCPHDGPSLAIASGLLNVAWMDAHTGKNRVYLATSSPTELKFAIQELTAEPAQAQGHPKIASTSRGKLVVVWDESIGDPPAKSIDGDHGHGEGHGQAPSQTGGGRAIMVAVSDRTRFGPARPVAARPGAFQLQPSLAIGPEGTAFVVWNELDEGGNKVVFAQVAR